MIEAAEALPRSFERFVSEQERALQQMSRIFKASYSVDELHAEAWIVACTVGAERERCLDLCQSSDQQLLLERLRRHVNATRSRFGTLSIDYSLGKDHGGPLLRDVLPAPENSDPLAWFQVSEEERIDWGALVKATYAEIAAYVLLFIRFEWDRSKVADCLRVSIAALRRRLVAACDRAKTQPSLFDGIDHIDPGFEPSIAKVAYACGVDAAEAEQLALL